MPSSPARLEAATDDRSCGYDVLRAIVMTLVVSYYRSRPADTRFEKKALAALPAGRRAMAAIELGRVLEAARKQARQADA